MTPCSICCMVAADPPVATHCRRAPGLQGEPVAVCEGCAREIDAEHPHKLPSLHEKVMAVADCLLIGWLIWIDSAGLAAVCVTSCPERPALVGSDLLLPLARLCAVRASKREEL